ncbi:MAG: ferritin-like domain-containing protein [Kiloniellales bacterium]
MLTLKTIAGQSLPAPLMTASRRRFLSGLGTASLSASAVALLAGCESMAAGGDKQMADSAMMTKEDVSILNIALGLEHQAIGAYQLGAESGLLQKPVLGTAVLFQSQHKSHRDTLASTIVKLGGKPVESDSLADYAKQLDAAKLKNQSDVLKLALELEGGAANAYIGVIPSFHNGDLAKVAGRLAADEVMHWTVLQQALQQPLPTGALTFGA